MDLGAFARTASCRVARFLEARYGAKVANIPLSAPMEIHQDGKAVGSMSMTGSLRP